MFKRQEFSSKLFDQNNFYTNFINDLKEAKKQVLIESPFMTTRRINRLLPVLHRLTKHGVRVIVNTKPLNEHEGVYKGQARTCVGALQEIDVIVLMTVGHHRKLSIIDEEITWEGSLNILSQNDSCEIMRRITSNQVAKDLIKFVHLDRFQEIE